MGNTPSSAGRDSSAPVIAKRCYYELLGVERDATETDIKKAYKKKALELHPDRNFQNEEDSTKLFTEVQAAYEILSDPQERSWYDSHRDQILSGADKDDIARGEAAPSEHTISDEKIFQYRELLSRCKDFTDGGDSFYTIVRKIFEVIADEEIKAASNEGIEIPDFPSFGNSKTAYNPDVKEFYSTWSGFSTEKNFAWADMYRYAEAPDRRIRRIMERENKKLRDAEIAEFNADVRGFVLFIRKRDPRYQPNQVPQQSEKERQAYLKAQSAAQAAKARAENAAKMRGFKVADWTQAEEDYPEEFLSSEEESEEEEEEEPEKLECVVCRKVFKSEGQLDAHEKSNKHKKAVQALQRQMRKENKELNLDKQVPTPDQEESEEEALEEASSRQERAEPEPEPEPEPKRKDDSVDKVNLEDKVEDEEEEEKPSGISSKPNAFDALNQSDNDDDDDEEDSDHAPISAFHARISDEPPSLDNLSLDSSRPESTEPTESAGLKIGKAKARRLKKAQKASESASGSQAEEGHVCAGCSAQFPSKTKLFNHLKENPKHAKLVSVPAGGGGGKKKKGKK